MSVPPTLRTAARPWPPASRGLRRRQRRGGAAGGACGQGKTVRADRGPNCEAGGMRVGEIEILPLTDGVARMPPSEAFQMMGGAALNGKGGEDEDWQPHRAFLADDGMLEFAMGGFLMRTGDRVVVVDTGVGDLDRPPFKGGQFLESLAGHGVQPADVTDVVLTHLHFDHVGWTTRHGDVVFPNAAYRCDV